MSTKSRQRKVKLPIGNLHLDRKLLISFIRYVCIGGFVFVIGVGVFQLLLMSQLYRPLATTIAYTLAAVVHFTLNKFFNFKNFERSTANQLKTYLVVVTFCWLITLLIVEISVRFFGLQPLEAMVLSIIVNIPVGFIGHRYFTFASGFKSAWRRWQHRVRR